MVMLREEGFETPAILLPPPKQADAAGLVNPLKSIAASLMRLEDPDPARQWSRQELGEALKAQVDCIGKDDFAPLEAMLAAQAHVLHRLFAKASEKYATAKNERRRKAFSEVALKAQNYCRISVAAIAKLKEAKLSKMRNELINANLYDLKMRNKMRTSHEALDSAGTAEAITPDTYRQAMEKSWR